MSLRDEDLPTWAHTTCVMVIAGLFALPLLWMGIHAVWSANLAPTRGPDFGMWMFGGRPLQGLAAVIAGMSLLGLGSTFLALGLSWTRWAEGRRVWRWLPWGLCAISLLLSWWAVSLAGS